MSATITAAASAGAIEQAVQIGGAVLILVPFAAAQLGRLDQHGQAYLLLNVLGSGTLAAVAAAGSQWGFLLLEGVWLSVSAWGLFAVARGRPPGPAQ